MDIASFVELIGTLGFPIAVCVALGVFVFILWKQSAEREKALMTELTANRQVNEKFATIIAQHEIQLEEIKTDVKDIKEKLG